MKAVSIWAGAFLASAACTTAMGATLTFTDDFATPSALWSNLPDLGNWTGGNGQYYAQVPSNSPLTWSSLPFIFTNSNLSLTVTLNGLSDGGIWFDSFLTANGNNTGVVGVLLVLGGNAYGAGCREDLCPGAGSSIYWSVGPSYQLARNEQKNVFTPLGTYTITVLVNGNTFQAYNDPDGVFNANSVLLSTFVDSTFSSGQVSLYDYDSALSFSNFSVSGTLFNPNPVSAVPGPVIGAGIPGFILDCIGLLVWRRRLLSPAAAAIQPLQS
jgi:hypothetical protein